MKTPILKKNVFFGMNTFVLQVERFKCAICLLVARDALAHECGSVLFCESCWKKCMAKETGPKSNQLLDFLFVS